MSFKRRRQVLVHATIISAVLLPVYPSHAADEETAQLQRKTERLQRQIDALQQELKALQRQVAETKGAPKSPPAAPHGGNETKNPANPQPSRPDYARASPTKAPLGNAPWLKGVNITFGGFIEAAALYRNRNEVADMGSDFNTNIPLPNSPLYYEKEFRGSARQSRLSLLASGDIDPMQHLAAYFEMDFLGAGVTANSRSTDGYNPRLRQAYATYDNDNWHFHMLAGQSWSLITQFKVGITPREENTPLTIDGHEAVGFDRARSWQVRWVGDWNKIAWFGVSVESPQVNFLSNSNSAGDVGGSPIPPGLAINDLNTCSASGQLNSQTACSNDTIPDVVEKVALDPGWGHYEVFGVQRWFTDRVFAASIGTNKTTFGWGVGASVLLPVVPQYLELQGIVMAGQGIGRYGPGALADVTIAPNGSLAPIPVTHIFLGAVAHPWMGLELYAYAGREQANAKAWNIGGIPLGYGNPLFDNSGCFTENPTSGPAEPNDPITKGTCAANTRSSNEITVGFWQDLYKGDLGRLVFGGQYEYIKRNNFPGLVNGAIAPGPNPVEQVIMTSIRYYPFE
jgi:hypothetical protein